MSLKKIIIVSLLTISVTAWSQPQSNFDQQQVNFKIRLTAELSAIANHELKVPLANNSSGHIQSNTSSNGRCVSTILTINRRYPTRDALLNVFRFDSDHPEFILVNGGNDRYCHFEYYAFQNPNPLLMHAFARWRASNESDIHMRTFCARRFGEGHSLQISSMISQDIQNPSRAISIVDRDSSNVVVCNEGIGLYWAP